MKTHQARAAVLPIILFAAACASEQPEPILAQPVFDKFGNTSHHVCEAGEVVASTTAGQVVCEPAEDECVNGIITVSGELNCLEDDDPDDPDDPPSASTTNDPPSTGTPSGPTGMTSTGGSSSSF